VESNAELSAIPLSFTERELPPVFDPVIS
jgi:hypothetical protein